MPQFESISSSVLSLLYGPTLTSIYDCWKNHNFDYTDFCWLSDVSAYLLSFCCVHFFLVFSFLSLCNKEIPSITSQRAIFSTFIGSWEGSGVSPSSQVYQGFYSNQRVQINVEEFLAKGILVKLEFLYFSIFVFVY